MIQLYSHNLPPFADLQCKLTDLHIKNVTFITLIMTIMTNIKIMNRLLMMIATFTNILATRTTNEKRIVFLIQCWMHIKSGMNPFNDALPTSNEVVAMLALHQVASLC
jgi:hypothetical protein